MSPLLLALVLSADAGSLEAKATLLVEQLSRGETAAVALTFGPQLSKALPAEKVGEMWSQVQGQVGKLSAIGKVVLEPSEGKYTVAWVACVFAKGPFQVKAVYDSSERLEGIFVVPGEPPAEWKPPPYAATEKFEERAVTVKAAVDLPGFVTVPKGKGPFPAVVLVHGSGPNGRDEKVGAIRVFKDLAWGLSSRGIVVLRYDKRTLASPAAVRTVEEEVIDGARAAVKLLAAMKEVDPKRVSLLGHSQGAQLAPRIAKSAPGIKSLVLMAGPTRPLEEILDDQLDYLTKGMAADVRAGVLEKQRLFKAQVQSPGLKPDDKVLFPLGGESVGAYYLDQRGYQPAKAAAELKLPLLVLQGERDYQVSVKRDWPAWVEALGKKDTALLKTFPALNHLFVAGEGPSIPSEYERPGHVDVEVITTVGAFLSGPVSKKK